MRLIGRASYLVFGAMLGLATTSLANKEKKIPESVPGEYVVKLKDKVNVKKIGRAYLSELTGSYVKSVLPDQNIVVVKRPVFEIQSSAIETLSNHPEVEIVEPNYIYRINRMPNDPMVGQLWGLRNIGQQDSKKAPGVSGVDVGAEQAWDIETGSPNVLVAVIDTGVNYNHPDLKDNMWTNEAEANGVKGVDDDKNGFIDDIHGYNFAKNSGDSIDDHGHGTHCAGTIGAKGDDGKGIVGVAWNTKIMGVKFLDAAGSGTLENAIKSIDYATKMGAKIMSNSWGGGGFSETLKQSIERSHAAGALFVAAAGNESTNNDIDPGYPASYDVPNVISVAAINNKGQLASFSNYGKKSVHVAAPGVNIVSSTTDGYDSWSGTSMATPHVSGIAALLASNQPDLKNVELKERIVRTAKPISALKNKALSGGVANAFLSLTNTLPPEDPNDPSKWPTMEVSISSAHPYPNSAELVFEANASGAEQFALYFAKFDTEGNYDFVELYDANGVLLEKLSGRNDDSFSSIIKGNYVKIVLKSDKSVSKYGFDITKIAYKATNSTPTQPGSSY